MPQSTSHESLTIAINLRKAANRLPYMNAERMAAFPLRPDSSVSSRLDTSMGPDRHT